MRTDPRFPFQRLADRIRRPHGDARLYWQVQSTARVNGVELCFETFGEFSNPAVLLVAGMASSMEWWDTEFCERLAAGGRFVVRYDMRDTGQSTTSPPG